ncbi:MAG: hypothetical protein DRJ42_27665 [Deltaproteobacteria bacterium]|nr:MAG: hypothetical protein DRJ42_27665 [Deltaproteobacteria bacterium]
MLEVITRELGKDLDPFLEAGRRVFADDPTYIPPLTFELKDRLTPKKNPFFEHGEAALFTAHRDGQIVGRCSASIDHAHLERHKDETGFFGFFDTFDDEEAAHALLDAAKAWVRERGMKRIRGPLSLCINEEAGLLVEGFEHSPVLMMPHSRPYQGALVESAGFEPIKDLIAWRYDVHEIPPRAIRAWEQMRELPEVTIRSFRKKHLHRDINMMMEIFNDAWQENWGFVPATDAELAKVAEDLKIILDEDLAFFAEVDGRPVGMCVALPNLNEATHDLGGSIFPFGFAKLLWRTKVRGLKSARVITLGLRKEIRNKKRYGGLSTALYVELAKRGVRKGYEWAELSWTLDDNRPINVAIKAMGGKPYKRYRLYEASLD